MVELPGCRNLPCLRVGEANVLQENPISGGAVEPSLPCLMVILVPGREHEAVRIRLPCDQFVHVRVKLS